ncbi:hypothetical protein VNI00_008759 [Paramarasmius palmivorus]|uniref:F-box domain-containing protein n=1 Tax=Paramarasmius palmivorus TaxID=297713 RepID=A0AAW0CTE4_9AGAR
MNTSSPIPQTQRGKCTERLFRSTVSAAERPVLEQILKDAEAQLRDHETEINRLRASLASMENKRDGLKKKILRYRSLLAPVHRIPPEILQNVFTFFCEDTWLEKTLTQPLTLSRVCGRWREIVLSTPSLWSTIAIDYAEWPKDFHWLDFLVHLFLDRSKTSPITLTLNFEDDELRQDAVPSIEALVRHSSRWHRLRLYGIRQDVIQNPVFAPIKGSLPILVELLIEEDSYEFDDEFRCELFGHCPALTTISIRPECPLTLASMLPWGQIRHAKISNSFTNDGISFLKLLPNLDSIELVHFGDSLSSYRGEPVVLSAKQLSVVTHLRHDMACSVQNVTLGQLSSLRIDGCKDDCADKGDGDWKQWDEKPILDFIRRSGCSITSLTLQWVPITDEQLLRFLKLTPELENLCLEEYKIISNEPSPTNSIVTPTLLGALTIDHQGTSSPFLPRLNHIRFAVHDDLDQEALSKALLSRWNPDRAYAEEIGVDCIKSVDIVFIDENEEPVEALVSKLQWMGDVGVRLTIAARMPEEEDDED